MTGHAGIPGQVTVNTWWRSRTEPPIPPDRGIEAFQRSIPGFAATPLVPVPHLAAMLGVEQVYVKHERERLGLPSFKVVGASWAVGRAIAGRRGVRPPSSFAEARRMAAALDPGTTVTTATDGNHGRAVAHIARLLGLPCRIYVPAGMARARVDAIASEAAVVEVVDGSYDDTVRRSAAEAERVPGHLLVSDTSWPGYEEVPAAVVEGYSTIFAEACRQVETLGGTGFDAAFVPAGVGAFASAAVRSLAGRGCSVVTVEPTDADCVRRSLVAGAPVEAPRPHRSMMAGLNCGEVSRIAWPVLRDGVAVAVSVSDAEAEAAMRLLAAAGLPSSASGAASLAGAVAAAADPSGAARLFSGGGSRVLLLDTEGITDPQEYAAVLGDGPGSRPVR